ncbi:hypothetical protein BDAP_000503 [Binucleata daphniae]
MAIQNEKCVYILNLPNPDHLATIKQLHQIHTSTLSIKLSNSVLKNNILAVHLNSKAQAQEIIKNIDKKNINDNIIYAIQDCDAKEPTLDGEDKVNDKASNMITYTPIKRCNIGDFFVDDMKNERFFITNDNKFSEYDNVRSGENTEMYKIESNLFTSSLHGNFIATYKDSKIVIFTTIKNKLNVFSEIFVDNVKSMEFAENETYLIVMYRKIFDYTLIYNIFTGKKVFEGIIKNNTIKFTKNMEYFYFVNTNQIFRNVNYENVKMNVNNLIFSNIALEKFVLQKEFSRTNKCDEISEYAKIKDFEMFYEFNNIFVFLTNEKVKNIVLFDNEKELIRKNYVNLIKADFYSSKTRLYAVIERKITDRSIYSIDSFTSNKRITTNQFESDVIDVKCTDNAFVAVDDDNLVHFYELKGNSFFLSRTIKKNHKVIVSLNENGHICVLYDYDKDSIEFYDNGRIIKKYSHPGCTGIEWSCSNLYCVSMSVGLGTSGLLQFYDVNGRFLYKKMFNKLTQFKWRNYMKIEELEKIAEESYDLYAKEIENEDEDLKKMYEEHQKDNVEEQINNWIDFINKKREEIDEYNKMISSQ